VKKFFRQSAKYFTHSGCDNLPLELGENSIFVQQKALHKKCVFGSSGQVVTYKKAV
jgi:hypothetical protein